MAEKDIAEKNLADYNDVFADIVNVLLFHGREVVSENSLADVRETSQYKANGMLHEQERDVSKILKRGNVTVSLFGLENQTRIDKYMPIRVLGYDGVSYRQQLLHRGEHHIYPVITMVLYFGMQRWNSSRSIIDLMDVPEEFGPYVSDYEMKNLIEVAYLTPEQVKLFRSDFRYVADYFVQKRLTDDYKPGPDMIRHVDATLKLMAVVTGDRRFEEAAVMTSREQQEGGTNMEAILDRVENKGFERGMTEGRTEGLRQGVKLGEQNTIRTFISSRRARQESEQDIKKDVMEDFGLDEQEVDALMSPGDVE